MTTPFASLTSTRFAYRFDSKVKISDREFGHDVLHLTSYVEHGEIAFEIAAIITRALNGSPRTAKNEISGPFVARIWETSGEGGDLGRAAGVWDIRRPHPLQGLLSATPLGADQAVNAAIVDAAHVAAKALNECQFDWQSPV